MNASSVNHSDVLAEVPRQFEEHFERSFDAHTRLRRVISLSTQGVDVAIIIPEAMATLARSKGTGDTEDHAKKIQRAKEFAELAQKEVDSDFPVLHGLAVVAFWSWLENSVRGFASILLTLREEAYSSSAIQRLRVQAGRFMQLSKEEQMDYLIELLEADLASNLKRGINRFGSLLEPFGLSGQFSDDDKKRLFEFQQVRNVVAHRDGIADRRFIAECPWIPCHVGEPLLISGQMIGEYYKFSLKYLLEVYYRVGDLYGAKLRK